MKLYARTRDRVFVIDDGKLNHVELDVETARLGWMRMHTFVATVDETDRRKAHGHPLKAYEPTCGRCKEESLDFVSDGSDHEIVRLRGWLKKIADNCGGSAKRYADMALNGEEIR